MKIKHKLDFNQEYRCKEMKVWCHFQSKMAVA